MKHKYFYSLFTLFAIILNTSPIWAQENLAEPSAPTTNPTVGLGANSTGSTITFGVQRMEVGKDTFSLLFNTSTKNQPVTKATIGDTFLSPSLANKGFQFFWSGLRQRGKDQSKGDGAFVRLHGSFMDFAGSPTDVNKSDVSRSGYMLNPALGYQWLLGTYDVSTTDKDKKKSSIGIAAAYTWRILGGDVLTQSDDPVNANNAAFRKNLFGDDKKQIKGWEVTLYGNIGEVQPYVQINKFDGADRINGLSGTRVSIGARVLTNLFKGDAAPRVSLADNRYAQTLPKFSDINVRNNFRQDTPTNVAMLDPKTGLYFVVTVEKLSDGAVTALNQILNSKNQTLLTADAVQLEKDVEPLLRGKKKEQYFQNGNNMYRLRRVRISDIEDDPLVQQRLLQQSQLLF
jgi:hypothetical protein